MNYLYFRKKDEFLTPPRVDTFLKTHWFQFRKMVYNGPDPTETNPQDLTPPPRHDLIMNGYINDESDDEQHEHIGYEPLPQGPDSVLVDNEDNSDDEPEDVTTSNDQPLPVVPVIEPMENILTREVWCTPRPEDPIQMDSAKAQQVMSAMANFALPSTSIPEWAQSVSEDQWKNTLYDKINNLINH